MDIGAELYNTRVQILRKLVSAWSLALGDEISLDIRADAAFLVCDGEYIASVDIHRRFYDTLTEYHEYVHNRLTRIHSDFA